MNEYEWAVFRACGGGKWLRAYLAELSVENNVQKNKTDFPEMF
jgi:hypothetical protein